MRAPRPRATLDYMAPDPQLAAALARQRLELAARRELSEAQADSLAELVAAHHARAPGHDAGDWRACSRAVCREALAATAWRPRGGGVVGPGAGA